jgi:hypothetical protein
MNEQELADLFSEQLDRMLLGEEVTVPAEAAELNELLSLGQQFSQVQFTAGSAATAAFQGQLTTWFGMGMSAAGAGIPKSLLIGLIIAATALTGLVGGLLTLTSSDAPPAPTEETTAPSVIDSDAPAPAEKPTQTKPAAPPTKTMFCPRRSNLRRVKHWTCPARRRRVIRCNWPRPRWKTRWASPQPRPQPTPMK